MSSVFEKACFRNEIYLYCIKWRKTSMYLVPLKHVAELFTILRTDKPA